MNYGNLGYLNTRFTIELPSDVLRPIGIARNSELTGIPYRNKERPDIYDLVISPIPFWAWSRCVRLTIRLKNEAETFKSISKVIKDAGCATIQTEASRSGFRYKTWNMTLIVPNESKAEEYLSTERIYKGVLDKANKLIKKIEEHCKDSLFFDQELSYQKPITMSPNTALAYFHHYALKNKIEPFKLIAQSKYRIAPADDLTFNGTLTALSPDPKRKADYFSPSFLFAEMDTKDANLRVVLIPKHSVIAKKIMAIRVDWQSRGPSKNEEFEIRAQGLLNTLTEVFEKNWNIWRISAKMPANNGRIEIGRLNFLIETDSEIGINSEDIEKACKKACEDKFKNLLFHVKHRTLNELHERMLAAPNADIGKYRQIVISCSGSRKDDGEKLTNFLQKLGYDVELLFNLLVPGKNFIKELRNAIRASRIVFVLADKSFKIPSEALGVRDEVSMAIALGKPIIPIRLSGDSFDFEKDLPEYITSKTQGITIDISENGKTEAIRNIEKALYSPIWPPIDF